MGSADRKEPKGTSVLDGRVAVPLPQRLSISPKLTGRVATQENHLSRPTSLLTANVRKQNGGTRREQVAVGHRSDPDLEYPRLLHLDDHHV
jgi:hypothetical protein